MFEVYVHGQKVKKYHTRLQAVIYLILKGFCYRSRIGCFLSDLAEIREVKNENER